MDLISYLVHVSIYRSKFLLSYYYDCFIFMRSGECFPALQYAEAKEGRHTSFQE